MPESLLRIDHALFWLINAHHHPALDFFLGTVTNLGSGWVVAVVLLGIAVWRIPRHRLLPVIVICATGVALSGIVNSSIKQLVKRPRPVRYFASHQDQIPPGAAGVHVIGKTLRHRSFPSGHSQTAFAAATVLILVFGGWAWWTLILAVLVAYSRVYVGVHFPLDVLAGATIGAAVTAAVVAPALRRWSPREKPGPTGD